MNNNYIYMVTTHLDFKKVEKTIQIGGSWPKKIDLKPPSSGWARKKKEVEEGLRWLGLEKNNPKYFNSLIMENFLT